MRVTRLRLTNVRAIEAAEFGFQPGFNLVAGVNGVGKTTVLDALAVCLSAIVGYLGGPRRGSVHFEADDIRVGGDALQVECGFVHAEEVTTYTLQRSRESIILTKDKDQFARSREDQTADTGLTIEDFSPRLAIEGEARPSRGRPLAVLFSTNRAVSSSRASGRAAAGGVNAAHTGALLKTRELRLAEFAAWMRAQEALGAERDAAKRDAAKRVLAAFAAAVTRFLPDYSNFRVDLANRRAGRLLIDRGDVTLPVQSLSDGERGMLSLVLDLTRRLAQANPELDDPAAEAEAVVLIDEIELHLHPSWQRRIVWNLVHTFPRCQFIATTHSPQTIGEVRHDRVNIISDGEVYPPTHSYGVDSSRVLEEIMEADSRTKDVYELLPRISGAIREKKYEEARDLLANLSGHLGENDPEVVRFVNLLEFMTDE